MCSSEAVIFLQQDKFLPPQAFLLKIIFEKLSYQNAFSFNQIEF